MVLRSVHMYRRELYNIEENFYRILFINVQEPCAHSRAVFIMALVTDEMAVLAYGVRRLLLSAHGAAAHNGLTRIDQGLAADEAVIEAFLLPAAAT